MSPNTAVHFFKNYDKFNLVLLLQTPTNIFARLALFWMLINTRKI